MTPQVSLARPHPWGPSVSARVYTTVSKSGETYTPYTQSSSPVFTTTVVSQASSRENPRASRAPPTPPERSSTSGFWSSAFIGGLYS